MKVFQFIAKKNPVRAFIPYYLITLITLFSFSSLASQTIERKEKGTVIDLDKAKNNREESFLYSSLYKGIKTILLETNESCLIGSMKKMRVYDPYIIVLDVSKAKSIFLFDMNGRFVRKIGSVGQGPGEYNTISSIFVDEKDPLLYIETFRTVLKYSWDGVFRKLIHKAGNMGYLRAGEVYPLHDNLFIGHVPNDRGSELYNFILFNDSGHVIKGFDNYIKFEREGNWILGNDGSMKPFKVNQHIYVKECTNDTLYCLSEQYELIPQFVFNLGKYAFPKHLKETLPSPSSFKDFIDIPDRAGGVHPMVGTPGYIFFNVAGGYGHFSRPEGRKRETFVMGQMVNVGVGSNLNGLYDIAMQTVRFLDNDPVSRMFGLINDLDGGLSFWPRYYTSANELVDVWQAYEMKEILTEAYFAAHVIKDPHAHQKLKELLKNLDEEDNPVIVIGKLK